MCIILDVNVWPDFLNQESVAMSPVRKWLEKQNGKLAYSDHEKWQKELSEKQIKILEKYHQKGQARFVLPKKIDTKITEIKKTHTPKSNDIHILGLAKASNTKILCTKDKNLKQDFKSIIKGKIYKNQKHKHLLKPDTCP